MVAGGIGARGGGMGEGMTMKSVSKGAGYLKIGLRCQNDH